MLVPHTYFTTRLTIILAHISQFHSPSNSSSTVNDQYSGHRFSGNNHFSGQIIQKTTILEENEPVLFTGLEDTTALEDKKGLTVFSAKPVVDCTMPRHTGQGTTVAFEPFGSAYIVQSLLQQPSQ